MHTRAAGAFYAGRGGDVRSKMGTRGPGCLRWRGRGENEWEVRVGRTGGRRGGVPPWGVRCPAARGASVSLRSRNKQRECVPRRARAFALALDARGGPECGGLASREVLCVCGWVRSAVARRGTGPEAAKRARVLAAAAARVRRPAATSSSFDAVWRGSDALCDGSVKEGSPVAHAFRSSVSAEKENWGAGAFDRRASERGRGLVLLGPGGKNERGGSCVRAEWAGACARSGPRLLLRRVGGVGAGARRRGARKRLWMFVWGSQRGVSCARRAEGWATRVDRRTPRRG